MAELQSSNILGTLSINGVELASSKTVKYEEFTSSGTFTPTQAAIDAGGVHQIFIVGGGERGISADIGGCGGEVIEKLITLTTTSSVSVTIGAGGTSNGADGGSSTFAGSSAGGTDIVAAGGAGGNAPTIKTSGAGGSYGTTTTTCSPGATINTSNPGTPFICYCSAFQHYGYQSAYAYRYAFSNSSAFSTEAGNGYKGYGAGGKASNGGSGISTPVANSGAGSAVNINAASGYCLVVWGE